MKIDKTGFYRTLGGYFGPPSPELLKYLGITHPDKPLGGYFGPPSPELLKYLAALQPATAKGDV